jgi:ribosomal protein S27AE
MDATATPDGDTVYVDTGDGERGSKGVFLAVYRDREQERRYGYYCDNCGSLATAMDTMGRLVCTECGNQRKPEEWDAAHE